MIMRMICPNSKTRVSIYSHSFLPNTPKSWSNISLLDGPKLNRGEKKCRKALLKIGMKQFAGVTRVTLRKRDGLIFVVNDPEVLRSEGDGKSFAVFGELKLEDPNTRLQ